MRILIPAALAIMLFVSACSNNNKTSLKYLNTQKLVEQTFTINTQEDTAIITKDGIKVFIPANAIEAGNKTITLTIKEALDLEDMLRAGLTTTGDKGILTSDGMFYIGTKERSDIKKPLQISLPTLATDDSMQLYKGIEENGKINWQSPENIHKTTHAFTDTGRTIFTTNCVSCHGIDKPLIGPALAWEDKHRSRQWLQNFTRSPATVLKNGDKYACCIFAQYHSEMTEFNNLTDNEIDAVYRYIDKISKQMGLPENTSYNSCDSCEYYHDYYYSLTRKRDSLVKDNGKMVNIKVTEPADADPNADNGTIPDKVRPESFYAEYYQFNITVFGWYNIDDLVAGRFNSVESNLKVTLNSTGTSRLEVFIVLPEFKVFTEGGLLNSGSAYGFYTDDGQIFLPQAAKAFVFALGEEKGKLYFGETSFITSLSASIPIDVHESTQKEMDDFFKKIKRQKFFFSINKTKNFDSIKSLDEEIDNARRISDACSCQVSPTASTIKLQ